MDSDGDFEYGSAPAPERYASADQRVQAALAHKEAEAARITSAREALGIALGSTPLVPRSYLVSLERPRALTALLEAARIAGLEPTMVYVWLQTDPDSGEVTVGEHDIRSFGWSLTSGSQKPTADLGDYYERVLQGRLDFDARAGDISSTLATLQAKLSQVKEGLRSFGFRCLCTPKQLSDLAAGGVALRAAETGTDHQQPIWPFDPDRDRVIATGGRYGR
ncbi:MAG: hypothetical protein ACLGH3_03945 [Actinomycetota bacterium]